LSLNNPFDCRGTDAFVESLGRLARDHGLLTRMKHAARAYAEQHLDAQVMLSNYEERLQSLTQQNEWTPNNI
jgi:hypothetical protein